MHIILGTKFTQSFCTLHAVTEKHSSTSFAFGEKRTISQINAAYYNIFWQLSAINHTGIFEILVTLALWVFFIDSET